MFNICIRLLCFSYMFRCHVHHHYAIHLNPDIVIKFPPPNAATCPFVDFVVPPPGHGRSVTDF